MISFLEVEWLKTRRSLIRWIVFLSPIIISGCAVSYLIYRKDISNYTIYQSFFSIWSACIIPIGVGIITGYLIYEENLSNSFNIILDMARIITPRPIEFSCINTSILNIFLLLFFLFEIHIFL